MRPRASLPRLLAVVVGMGLAVPVLCGIWARDEPKAPTQGRSSAAAANAAPDAGTSPRGKLVPVRPDCPRSHRDLWIVGRPEEVEEARAELDKLRKTGHGPGAAARISLLEGVLLYYQARYGEALNHFEVALADEQPTHHYWAGRALGARDAGLEELMHYERALKLDPRHPGALLGTARAYLRQRRHKEAVRFLQEYIEVVPDDLIGKLYLAEAWGELGQYERALEVVLPLAKTDPKSAQVLSEAGRLLVMAGRLEDGVSYLKAARAAEGGAADAACELALVNARSTHLLGEPLLRELEACERDACASEGLRSDARRILRRDRGRPRQLVPVRPRPGPAAPGTPE